MAELQTGGNNDNMELDQATVHDEAVDSHIMIESETNSALHSFGPENIQSTDTGDTVDDSAGFNPNVSDDELRSSFIQSSGPENIQPSDSGVDDLEISNDFRNVIRDSPSASGNDIRDSTSASGKDIRDSTSSSRNDIRDSTSASGMREADEAYNLFLEEFFPNYKEAVYKVPRVFFGNHPCKADDNFRREIQSSLKETVPVYLYDRTESDIAGDRAEKIVADSIEKLLMEENHPAFIITSFKFINFCNKKDEPPEQDENKYVKQLDGKAEEKREGEHDLLIVHLKYGVISIQVKSTQENTDPSNTTKKAISQTEKDEEFFKANFDDIILNISDMINSTIALPDIEREKLDSKCQTKIEKKYEKSGKLDHCLFKDEMANMGKLRKWWSNFTTKSVGFKTIDDYKRVVARYIGKKSTVKVPVIHHRKSPNESFPDGRSYSDCVSEMGNRYMNLLLTPEQWYILNNAHQRLVIHGQFGTGKTVLLILKVRSLLREKKKVCVITMCLSPLEQVLRTSITHEINQDEIERLEFKQTLDQKKLSEILKDCAKLDKHVFIDEFPSFTKKDDNLLATIKDYPNDLMFWCIMSNERAEYLRSPVDGLFEPKPYCDQTTAVVNSTQSNESDGTFIHLRLSKILRCPPVVHKILTSPSNREKEIVRYNFGNIEVPQRYVAEHFHSLALSTPNTINVLNGSKPTECPEIEWKDVVVMSAETHRPFYKSLQRLQIPLLSYGCMIKETDKTNKAQYVFKVPLNDSFKRVAIVRGNLHCSIYVKGQGEERKIEMKGELIAQLLAVYGFMNNERLKEILKRRGFSEEEIKKRLDEVLAKRSFSEDGTQEHANKSSRDWSEVIFVEETTSYIVLKELGIPFVTPADDTVVNKVLYTTKHDFKGYFRKEVIVFKDGKAIANPCEDICYEGPEILEMGHIKYAGVIQNCEPCKTKLREIVKDLGLINHEGTQANTVSGEGHLHPSNPSKPRQSAQPSVSDNKLSPRQDLTSADVLIVDVRQNPESIAELFRDCQLPVLDKLNADSVNEMTFSSSALYVKSHMTNGLEKKVVFVVKDNNEPEESLSSFGIREDPLMLAYSRCTSQLVIITTT